MARTISYEISYKRQRSDYRRISKTKLPLNYWVRRKKQTLRAADVLKILPGQYFDEETGLHYNYFRYYDPTLGRYIKSDSTGLSAGPNTYGYALQNPIMYYDPNGAIATTVEGAGIGGIIGGPPGAIIGGIIGTAIGIWIGYEYIWDSASDSEDCPDACPPCKTVSGRIVPVGTIGYRPLDTPDSPQHGIDGPHFNLLKANQIPKGNPVGECDCFWQPIGAVSPAELPAGAIPAEPFVN